MRLPCDGASTYLRISSFGDNLEFAFFGAPTSVGALFICRWGIMEEKVIDISGVELTPGEPAICLGNGKQGFDCCCDECDYFLLCFPEFDPKAAEETVSAD